IAGGPLPSARAISTTVFDPNQNIGRHEHLNMFLVFFGQFMSHDFTRFAEGDVREQLNEATAFIDASTVYGSNALDLEQVRLYSKGLLKTVPCDSEDYPPVDQNNITECSNEHENRIYPCLFAGDERINENPALALHHIIWVREHNWIARELAIINPEWEDERLFQESRKIVAAEIQHIFYNEFLPLIIGDHIWLRARLSSFTKYEYDSLINPGVENSISTAVFRFGHGMLTDNLLFFGGCPGKGAKCDPQSLNSGMQQDNNPFNQITSTVPPLDSHCAAVKKVELSSVFRQVDPLFDSSTDMDALLRGLLRDKAQTASDTMLTTAITERLFGHMDLMARNIQRGRDNGLPPYNMWRKSCGLKPAQQFNTGTNGFIDHKLDVVQRFQAIYRHPNDVDLVIGGITENPVAGGVVGPTYACIMARQFHDLKFGDRFWYQNKKEFSQAQLTQIYATSLKKVLMRTTKINEVPESIFHIGSAM
ncbi:chorion peroxidase-like, partial [Argonauta hians]